MFAASRTRPARCLIGAAGWLLGWVAAWSLEGIADLGNQALPLVLAAAFTSLWWPAWLAALACVASVLSFNWLFVLPLGSFEVSLARDALLLATMLAVSLGITFLMARQRRLAHTSELQARRVEALHGLSEALRTASDVPAAHRTLDTALRQACEQAGARGATTRALWLDAAAPQATAQVFGSPGTDEVSGLTLCRQQSTPMGPGTRVYENQPGWYLPARGRLGAQGAVLIEAHPEALRDTELRRHVQALCDLAGQAVERLNADAAARVARQAAEAHALRNTLLAAVSHDYRTPLASILGAATSLSQQGDRLTPAQRQRLADTIADEAAQLGRLTDNALQLARLDSGPAALQTDWESLEEIVGAVLRRVRSRAPGRRLQARIEAGLPLLRCDAVLVAQLLENLLDNALRYAPGEPAIEVKGWQQAEHVRLAVRDRGPGIPDAERERVSEAFERGEAGRRSGTRGAGLGLALCRAIAQSHGAAFTLRNRRGGGCHVEVGFPLAAPPAIQIEEGTA
jgi:two-component system sensor histidine kinase KdpD